MFQKRLDGSVDFYRDWDAYKRGFGSLTGEFWLGLDKIHRLTSSGRTYTLRVDVGDFRGIITYAEYYFFEVSSERETYRLSLRSYSGLNFLRSLVNVISVTTDSVEIKFQYTQYGP